MPPPKKKKKKESKNQGPCLCSRCLETAFQGLKFISGEKYGLRKGVPEFTGCVHGRLRVPVYACVRVGKNRYENVLQVEYCVVSSEVEAHS